MPTIVVNTDWCKGCYLCVELCPRHVLDIDPTAFVQGVHPVVVARPQDCSACRQCELLCPDLAIQVDDDQAESPLD
jgi:2-oxoglutarate ferredoxin oxidoreductase subunit delta